MVVSEMERTEICPVHKRVSHCLIYEAFCGPSWQCKANLVLPCHLEPCLCQPSAHSDPRYIELSS